MKKEDELSVRGIIIQGMVSGVEFALTTVVFIFIGYFLGSKVNGLIAVIGTILGAFIGFCIGTYRLVKKAQQVSVISDNPGKYSLNK